jgi:phytoene dehydrogenase-like protein
MNNWGGEDKELYQKLKEEVLAALIDKASNIIANLHDHVEFADLATPLTYERYTHNTGGATSAWSWNPQNKFHKSLMKSHVETPVKNLYIGSCWAMQIGGIPGAISAAYECAKRIK